MNPGSGRDFRQGQNKQRMRGRGNNNNNRKGPNPLTRSYESNGPDVKIRGTALHIAEKYVQLARDAQVAGDRVAAENYLQHAEHYYRIIAAAQAQMPQPQPVFRSDEEGDEDDGENRTNGFGQQPRAGEQQPSFGGNEPQPFVNGNGQGQPEEEPQRPPASTHTEEGRFEPQENFADRGGGDYNRDSNQRGGQNDRGGYRGRRRRPFRERYGQQGGGGDGQNAAPAPAGGDAPSGDE